MEVEYKFLYSDLIDKSNVMKVVDILNENEEIGFCQINFQDIVTKYIDCHTGVLRKGGIAMRHRTEVNNCMSFEDENHKAEPIEETRETISFKWGGEAEGGLHVRKEVEFQLGDEPMDFTKLDPEVYKKFTEADDEGLEELFTTAIQRVAILVDCGESNVEVALDAGFLIKTEGDVTPEDRRINKLLNSGKDSETMADILKDISPKHLITELEIELKEGREEDLTFVADYLRKKLPLKPNDVSKYKRGIELYNLANC